jgi:hypothetical protein
MPGARRAGAAVMKVTICVACARARAAGLRTRGTAKSSRVRNARRSRAAPGLKHGRLGVDNDCGRRGQTR